MVDGPWSVVVVSGHGLGHDRGPWSVVLVEVVVMVGGRWSVVRGLCPWSVVCGWWSVVYGPWSVVVVCGRGRGPWSVVMFVVGGLVHVRGPWSVVGGCGRSRGRGHGPRSLVRGPWSVIGGWWFMWLVLLVQKLMMIVEVNATRVEVNAVD
ncbi:hypothetical protein Tco_1324217, partial [Tanacetum coccineum]